MLIFNTTQPVTHVQVVDTSMGMLDSQTQLYLLIYFAHAEDPRSHLGLFTISGSSALLPQENPFHPPNNPPELQGEGTSAKFVFLVYIYN